MMTNQLNGSKIILIIGSLLIIYATISIIMYLFFRFKYSYPTNMAISQGNGIFAAIGFLAILVGNSLLKIENNLSEIEKRIAEIKQEGV